MRKTIKAIGAILIIFVVICIFVGSFAINPHEQYNKKRKVIIKQCEEALPILTRRYQAFFPLLELCEKQAIWTDSFEAFTQEAPPAFITTPSQTAEAEMK